MQTPKRIFFAIIFFLGWALSPVTWWNDALVNLPLSYLAASAISKFLPRSFLPAFLISYWATNILGILLMYAVAEQLAAKELLRKKRRAFLIMILVYSVISVFLIIFKIIKPFY